MANVNRRDFLNALGVTIGAAATASAGILSGPGKAEAAEPPKGNIPNTPYKVGHMTFFTGPALSLGGTAGSLHIYVKDVDAAFRRAVEAGAQVRMPVADMFWGDRYGRVADPFGHEWGLGTHKEDLTPDEIRVRATAFFSKMRT